MKVISEYSEIKRLKISDMKTFIITIFLLFSYINSFSQEQWLNINYTNDGTEYHNMDIYLPDNGEPTHKAIIIIYGSAWFANNLKGMAYQAMGKPLLENGFAVISINHRSSMDAPYPAQIHDVKAAIRFIRANADQYHIDDSFIGITGFSSGGHLASLAGVTNNLSEYTVADTTMNLEGSLGDYTSTSSSVDAVVDWFGPVDLANMDNNCTEFKDANSPEAAMINGNPADQPSTIALLSPVTFVDETDPPFLVIHGDADNVVPHCQSELFSGLLDKAGILADFITVEGGGHGPVTFNENTFNAMIKFFLATSE